MSVKTGKTQGKSVLVVGGGIGGMAAALALAQAGNKVEVFEQAAEIGEDDARKLLRLVDALEDDDDVQDVVFDVEIPEAVLAEQ